MTASANLARDRARKRKYLYRSERCCKYALSVLHFFTVDDNLLHQQVLCDRLHT